MVSGRSASNRVIFRHPTHLLLAVEPHEFALGPRRPRLDQGCRTSPNPPTAGRRAAEVCLWFLAAVPQQGVSCIPQPTHCRPPSRMSSPLVPGRSAWTQVVAHLPPHPLASSGPAQEPKDEAAYHFKCRDRGPDSPPELWSPTSAHGLAPCGPRKKPQPLTVVRPLAADGRASSMAPEGHHEGSSGENGFSSSPGPGRVECPT